MSLPQKPTSCPKLESFLNLLTGPWTLYILWILCTNGPTRFGALKQQIQGISSKLLTERLRMLEEAKIVYRDYKPSIPPQVTYGLTARGRDLIVVLNQLNAISERWYEQDQKETLEPVLTDKSS